MYPGMHKVRYRQRLKMYTLFELLLQCLCNLVQHTRLEVDYRMVHTYRKLWAVGHVWQAFGTNTHLKMRTQDFHPQKTRENPLTEHDPRMESTNSWLVLNIFLWFRNGHRQNTGHVVLFLGKPFAS